MTREEIEQQIEKKKLYINDYEMRVKNLTKEKVDLEKQLQQLDVEVYEPKYLYAGNEFIGFVSNKIVDVNFMVRHNAGEELKKLISEENAKQGWKVDWEDYLQYKFYLNGYFHQVKEVGISYCYYQQLFENELYFSEQSSKDQDFLAKIEPLWLKWKGIE